MKPGSEPRQSDSRPEKRPFFGHAWSSYCVFKLVLQERSSESWFCVLIYNLVLPN